jgi:hypothetical protein
MAFGLDDFGNGVVDAHEKVRVLTKAGPAIRPCPVILALDLVRYLFDRLAELAAATPEPFLDLPRRLVCNTFVVQILIVCKVSGGLLDLPLHLLGLAIEFVLIHCGPPLVVLQKAVPEP